MEAAVPAASPAQRSGPTSPQRGLAELFPELHGLVARAALRGESDALEAWQRLRLVNKAWYDGLKGATRPSSPVCPPSS